MKFENIIDKISNAKILVVGDVMLDRYIFGAVTRISPEAPVPVIKATKEIESLGGAANVANNVAMLQGNCTIVGVAGKDGYYEALTSMLNKLNVKSFLFDAGINTTAKIRVVGERQQITRIDYEEQLSADHIVFKNLSACVIENLPNNDVLVISDYGKGVVSTKFCQQIITYANSLNKITVIDPKGSDWSKYSGATIVTPNVKELGEVYGSNLPNEDDVLVRAARIIREKYQIKYLVLTRSEKGMSVISETDAVHLPTHAREVYDVSGAGDTVVATLACTLGSGADIEEAALTANIAAGVVVSKMGTAPITYSELLEAASNRISSIVPFDKLLAVIEDYKNKGKKVVFTNGCFDILHRGHVDYLQKAKNLGDVLIVGLNSDASVKKLKGEGRPVNNQEDRAFMLSALSSVDYVVLFEENTPEKLIKAINPDYLVKGGDYTPETVVGRKYAKEVVIIDFVEGYSTTSMMNKLKGGTK